MSRSTIEYEEYDNAEDQHAGVPVDISRSALVARVILFQFKLLADGLRDVLLSPLSIVAAVAGILFSQNDVHGYFNRLLRWGRKTDRWINLFDNHVDHTANTPSSTIDDLAHKFESAVREDYRHNGVSAKTVAKMEEMLHELKRRHTNS